MKTISKPGWNQLGSSCLRPTTAPFRRPTDSYSTPLLTKLQVACNSLLRIDWNAAEAGRRTSLGTADELSRPLHRFKASLCVETVEMHPAHTSDELTIFDENLMPAVDSVAE